ncbi:diguanylate cyclase (GGDEF) domain-containing protein [Marinobacter antarcticus]|uniref:diguanylate cyclase n=1 Tax=Marinobacter antarcticus TaxID=564117 RepID=A0A1M6RAU9_9GAMM|nr:GGDEF domain-containing protein [Marinobacter antarcticus]SHK29540.1 diguanylate cyclase (GGDEF) domain-containing protein [Marinobacter antarcticus]
MPKVSVNPNYYSPRDMLMLRLSILIGGVLIGLFMIGDLQMVPKGLVDAYVTNRAFVQLPIVFALLASSFHPRFLQFAQAAFFLTILSLVYTNYYLIHVSWKLAAFSFPYEGTFLYAFFGFFVLGMTFRYALWLMFLSSAGFICLMLLDSVYGDRTFMNAGFVVGSLFIGVIGRHRLDLLLGELKGANEQLITLSTTDGLTGLLNRRAFTSESERLFAILRRSGQPLAVFMIDLDHFKQFNDCYGHQEGDRAIRCQADILRSVFKRETDILGRYGGEEFIVVAEGHSASESERQAARILTQWQDLAMPNEGSTSGKFLTCSIGICHGMPADYDSLENMIKTADEALYSVKERGRGRSIVDGGLTAQ